MDEGWTEPEAVTTECGWCGEERPCLLLDDPFIRDVYPEDLSEDDIRWWCWPCYERRAGDV
jgi:hypothetical protein